MASAGGRAREACRVPAPLCLFLPLCGAELTRPTPPLPLSLPQFFIYFVYFLVLFGVYLLGALVVLLRHFRDGRRAPQPPALSPAEEKAMQPLAALEQSLQPEAKA